MARLIWVIHQQTRDVTGRYHATPPQTGPDPIGALCLRSFELRLAIYGRQRYIATNGDGFETIPIREGQVRFGSVRAAFLPNAERPGTCRIT